MKKRAVRAPAAGKAPAARKSTVKVSPRDIAEALKSPQAADAMKKGSKAIADALTKPNPLFKLTKPKSRAPSAPVAPEPAPQVEPTPEQLQRDKWEAFKGHPDSIDKLCVFVVEGGHLNGFCKQTGFSYTSMLRWIDSDHGRSEMYARAREDRSDIWAEETIAIADDSKNDTYVDDKGVTRTDHEVVQRSKLRVDARKWMAAKMKPRVYGDKLTLDNNINTQSLTDERLLTELQKLGIAATLTPVAEGAPSA